MSSNVRKAKDGSGDKKKYKMAQYNILACPSYALLHLNNKGG